MMHPPHPRPPPARKMSATDMVHSLKTRPYLGLVRLQATVIPCGAPTTPYPNTKTYINDFIKI